MFVDIRTKNHSQKNNLQKQLPTVIFKKNDSESYLHYSRLIFFDIIAVCQCLKMLFVQLVYADV